MNFMDVAIGEAKKAYDEDEVPVGAVIVKGGQIISVAHNTCEKTNDCTCHAEINAIKTATEITGEKTLEKCDLYVTVEPCAMCSGAIINSRIRRVYIGCEEVKTGCMGSVVNLSDKFPWKPEVYFGFNEDECKNLMKKFFAQKRENHR